jgi:tetratricopeptide (TPR) repeat protein
MISTTKRTLRIAVSLMAAVLTGSAGQAQVHLPAQPAIRSATQPQDLLRENHYQLATQAAQQYLAAIPAYPPADRSMQLQAAAYAKAIAGLKTNGHAAIDSALAFAEQSSQYSYRKRVHFALAQYYFSKEQFKLAIQQFEATGIDQLTNSEIADAKFELAYCYFIIKQFDKAYPLFAAIREVPNGKYYVAGNYYYGLLAYNDNNFAEALASFERIKDKGEYSSVVRYYIAEVNYFMGNRAAALARAEELINSKQKNYYDKEAHMLAAQCLFEDQKYKEAKVYFEYFYERAIKIRKEDLYKMGYCYYRLGEWSSAKQKLVLLSDTKDSLGQSSMYILGDCHLKTGDRKSARNAFAICAETEFNKGQQEASLMLYARLSYEAGYNDEAKRALTELLQKFPKSSYKDEARTLLSSLFIKSNDFDGALTYLSGVSSKDTMYYQVYQKAAYGRAIQLFREGKLEDASAYFSKSMERPQYSAYTSAAYFWKSEIAWKLRQYNETITNGRYFLNSKPDAKVLMTFSPQATAQHANLNMGYAAVELQDFSAAQNYFYLAQQNQDDDNTSASIAALQEADAVFLQQNYSKAVNLYDKILGRDSVNADYARYQKSIILGLQGKNNEKLKELGILITKRPPSAYELSARYEGAITYIELNKYNEALAQLKNITDSAADKSMAPKAWLKTGFIHQQATNMPQAIEAYKTVVVQYPASDERVPALDALKSIFIQMNKPAAFAQLLQESGLPAAESAGVDSTYYAAAETQFATGKWDVAKAAFNNYLGQFPNGIFAIKAYYYRGQSNYQLRNYNEALTDFNKVLTGGWNDFSENSARNAAAIAYELKEYSAAYSYYLQLRLRGFRDAESMQQACIGLIKSGYKAGKYGEADAYADTLLRLPDVPADQITEGLLYKAKAGQQLGKIDTAMALYQQLSDTRNGEIAAEARYHFAELLAGKDSLSAAETAANESIKLSSGYDYWIVKSYILLADILTKQHDYFNAKATLSSIIKNTKNEELKLEAAAKLATLKSLEKTNSKLKDE